MRASVALTFVTAALAAAEPAVGQGNNGNVQWITKLVGDHINREFCPPAGSTYGMMIRKVGEFRASHPAKKSDMTDAEWVSLLGAVYPCNHTSAPAATETGALGSKPLGSVGGIHTVRPAGVYGTIDTAPSSTLIGVLHAPPSKELDRQITIIEAHSGDYVPPVLMQMANALFNAGKRDDAVFWFHAGLLRTMLDVRLSTEPGVADLPTLMVQEMPLKLVKTAISADSKISEIIQRDVAWDAKTAYNYDHRWVALHGTGAAQSAFDPTHAPTTLTVPDAQWPTIIAANRAAYASFISNNAARVQATQN